MLRLLKQRDRKEAELDTLKEQIKINKEAEVRQEFNFEKRLALYKEWKADNKVEGTKY